MLGVVVELMRTLDLETWPHGESVSLMRQKELAGEAGPSLCKYVLAEARFRAGTIPWFVLT